MTKYIIGEIFSSSGATLYKNPSDQTVNVLHLEKKFRLHGEIMSKYLLVQGVVDSMRCIWMVTEEVMYGLMMQNFFKYFGMQILMQQTMDLKP